MTQASAKISPAQQGFTLLEVLVVITIIGIVIGITVLSFGAVDQRRLTSEASRLKLAFNHASDAALMKQLTLGWFYQEEANQYYFLTLNQEGTWEETDDAAFKPYTINGPLILTIEEPLQLQKNPTKHQNDITDFQETPTDEEQPNLLFLSSGEYTVFKIHMADNKRDPIQILGDGFGSITTEWGQRNE